MQQGGGFQCRLCGSFTCPDCRHEEVGVSTCKYCDAFECDECYEDHELAEDEPFSRVCSDCGHAVCSDCMMDVGKAKLCCKCDIPTCVECMHKPGCHGVNPYLGSQVYCRLRRRYLNGHALGSVTCILHSSVPVPNGHI